MIGVGRKGWCWRGRCLAAEGRCKESEGRHLMVAGYAVSRRRTKCLDRGPLPAESERRHLTITGDAVSGKASYENRKLGIAGAVRSGAATLLKGCFSPPQHSTDSSYAPNVPPFFLQSKVRSSTASSIDSKCSIS